MRAAWLLDEWIFDHAAHAVKRIFWIAPVAWADPMLILPAWRVAHVCPKT